MTNIAVVIPVFNLGRFLADAHESVMRQSRTALEVIIVDDGSTDLYTRQILASFKYANTRVVRQTNLGVAAARNHGIRLTSAEYIVTLDADDRLASEYLAQTAARLDSDPELGFVSTGIRAFGEASYTWTPECSLPGVLIHGAPHPASMFRRQVWVDVGGFDESRSVAGCEDFDFWVSALELGVRGDVIPEPLLDYRVRADSAHQSLVAGGRQSLVMEAVFRKHKETIGRIGTGLLIEKENFLERHRAHQSSLREKRSSLEREFSAIESDITRTVGELSQRGAKPLEWGDIEGRDSFGTETLERGTPINVSYIRDFLRQHGAGCRGDVLILQGPSQEFHYPDLVRNINNMTIRPFAGPVELSNLQENTFDCVMTMDAFCASYDLKALLVELHRVLKPGGRLLCALPAAQPMTATRRDDYDYWRLTEAAARHLFAEVFPVDAFSVIGYGNVLVCAASMAGLAAEEMEPADLELVDPMFPLVYCVSAVKPTIISQREFV